MQMSWLTEFLLRIIRGVSRNFLMGGQKGAHTQRKVPHLKDVLQGVTLKFKSHCGFDKLYIYVFIYAIIKAKYAHLCILKQWLTYF